MTFFTIEKLQQAIQRYDAISADAIEILKSPGNPFRELLGVRVQQSDKVPSGELWLKVDGMLAERWLL